MVSQPCPVGNDENHTSLCFVKPDLGITEQRIGASASQEVKDEELTQIALGLISNKESIQMGLANASCPMEEYVQFDKDKIGFVHVSARISSL